MGMHITNSLTAGSGALAAPQEPAQGRRMSRPVEQRESGQTETALPGSRNPGSTESATSNQVIPSLEQMNLAFDRKLQFVLDQESSEITVKVIDKETDKVIKVLPPEELQRLHSGNREAMGFLVDRTV